MSKTKTADEQVAQQPVDNATPEPNNVKPEPSEKEKLEAELFKLAKQELLAKNFLQQIKDKKKVAEQNYLHFLSSEQINTNKKPDEFQIAFDEFQIVCE